MGAMMTQISSTLAVSPAHSFLNRTDAVGGITSATPNAVGMKIDATYYGVSASYKIRSVQNLTAFNQVWTYTNGQTETSGSLQLIFGVAFRKLTLRPQGESRCGRCIE